MQGELCFSVVVIIPMGPESEKHHEKFSNIILIKLLLFFNKNLSESQQKSANVEATIELKLYDIVEIGKHYASAMSSDKNFFEGRMIP